MPFPNPRSIGTASGAGRTVSADRAGATPDSGAYGAYRCAINGGGGWGPGHTGNAGTAAYVATFRFGKASALEPKGLPRRRFPLGTPFGVIGPMKTRPRLAV
jgi:hypothetical protein